LLLLACTRSSPQAPPDVLLLVVDTLRADALGRGITPNMDALAGRGTVYEKAWSTSSWTSPGVVSLLSGRLATVHRVGATDHGERLAEHVPLVQERFRDSGWATGSFVANPLAGEAVGLHRGFDQRFERSQLSSPSLGFPSADQVYAEALSWIETTGDTPWFGFVLTLEPHEWAGPSFEGEPTQRYDQAVARTDLHLGAFLDELARRGEDPLIVFTSDHGESLGERGVKGHGTTLFEEQVGVPLIVAGPGIEATTVSTPVSLVDVAPTLLERASLPGLGGDGQSLERPREGVTASLLLPLGRERGAQHAWLQDSGRKEMLVEGGRPSFFDLNSDPGELKPAMTDPAAFQALIAEQEQVGEAFQGAVNGDPEAAGPALKALGYTD